MYKKEEFKILQENGKIIGLSHEDIDDVDYEIIDEEYKKELLDRIIAYVKGEVQELKIWSDYDYEEPNTIQYLAVSKSGYIDKFLDLEDLIFYLYNASFDVYEIIIEDNLI